MTLEQIHKAVREGWHPPDGTPLMDFIWNAALDAAAEECRKDLEATDELVAAPYRCDGGQSERTALRIERRILALKEGGTQ